MATTNRQLGVERAPAAIKLAAGDVQETGDGYQFTAVAQFYGIVNDRLMLFEYGSGLKTIAEQVPRGRVKIHSGHPWDPNHHTIVGKVTAAEESRAEGGLVYTGMLDKTEEGLASKMVNGIIDENSLELYVYQERVDYVPVTEVPQQSRRWCEFSQDGKVKVRRIAEWGWTAIGLVSSSSQGRRALIDPPTLVSGSLDLPLAAANTPWEPEAARRRVEEWAGLGQTGTVGTATARLSRAYLARRPGDPSQFLGQVADVVAGQLVVVPAALRAAYAELEELASTSPDTAIAAARLIGRQEARLTTREAPIYDDAHTTHRDAALAASDVPPTAGPPVAPTERAGSSSRSRVTSSEALEREAKLRELQLDQLGGI